MDRCFQYHCSEVNHGSEMVYKRRVPDLPDPREPLVPRLCVSRFISCCFASRLFLPGNKVYVYRTRKPIAGVTPVGVWDAGICFERWIVDRTSLDLVDVVSVRDVDLISGPFYKWHFRTKHSANIYIRVAAIIRANEVLMQNFEETGGLLSGSRIRGLRKFMLKWGKMDVLNIFRDYKHGDCLQELACG